uniref:thioredoxin-dependent peroxiredoxin n=1 Tax=Arcella intermedia TaxID=1963864 RepID=A0A6B2LJ26_9EUKA
MGAPKAFVGAAAPHFEGEAVVGGSFKNIKLSDYKGKYVVFFWYPLDFTFVCPTEIVSFSDAAAKFKALNCEVIGASCDSKFSHLAWTNTPRKEGGLGKLNIPLLADFDKTIAADYGVFLHNQTFPLRATFIIDDKGTIRHLSFNDPPVGRSVDEVLRLVQGYQFVDKNGEVCPAGWKPGSATMKADPVKSKEYFSKLSEE